MIITFQDAIHYVRFARTWKESMPDGMNEELEEILEYYRWEGKPSTWSEEVREAFTEEIIDLYLKW